MGYGTKKRDYSAAGKPKREQRLTCTLSEEEEQISDRYLEKHKITNKSRWLRETVLRFVYKKMDEEYPTLLKNTI